jgi:hypothetical protein
MAGETGGLAGLLGNGATNIMDFFKGLGATPVPQNQPTATYNERPGGMWTPPEGAGFQGIGYEWAPDGSMQRTNPDGSITPFVPNAEQAQQLERNGMPGFAQQTATVEGAAAGPGKNILGSDNAKAITGALAAALQASQANQPKASAPSMGAVGSVMNPTNKLAELFQQTKVK